MLRKHSQLGIALVLVGIFGLITFTVDDFKNRNPNLPTVEENTALYQSKATRVIDGDTIILENNKTIRLIGIDAPEKNEPFYQESKDFLYFLLKDQPLEIKTGEDAYDNYGRQLAYVTKITTQELINLTMLEQGLATTMAIPPNTTYQEIFETAEIEAKVNQLGIWQLTTD